MDAYERMMSARLQKLSLSGGVTERSHGVLMFRGAVLWLVTRAALLNPSSTRVI